MIKFDENLCVARARQLIGVPYVHQGRSESQGFDCSGFIIECFTYAGWMPVKPRETLSLNYTEQGSWKRIIQALQEEGSEVSLSDAKICDLVVMRAYKDIPQHFALITEFKNDSIYIAHTHQGLGCVSEHRLNGPLLEKIHCVWRMKDRE